MLPCSVLRCPKGAHVEHNTSALARRPMLHAARVSGKLWLPGVRSSRSRSALRVQAIGFDFGDDDHKAPPKKANKVTSLGTLASSLLVFGPVLKGAVGEAFLAALAMTQKYQATNKDVLAAYAKFYSLLLTSGYDSWQNYLLDQLLLARDNPFARAVAQGNVESNAAIMKAVAYDLDVLQELSLPMEGLAEYVADIAPTAGPYWLEGASSVSLKAKPSQTKLLPGSAPPTEVTAIDPHTRVPYIQRPPSQEELAAWKAAISGKERWSEAAALVQQYYHLHGFGITSRNSALRWNKGAFEEGSEGGVNLPFAAVTTNSNPATAASPPQAASPSRLSCLESARAALAANTLRHAEGEPGAGHALVAGPSGSGKSWLLWDATLAAGRDKGLRIVDVPTSELNNLVDIARGCARYPRLRFIIVADHVDFPLRGSLAADLSGALTAGGPSGWPSNAILYVGVSATSTLSMDSVVSRFGSFITTEALDEGGFKRAVSELAAGVGLPVGDEDLSAAVAWASKRGGFSVRAAWQYVHSVKPRQ